MSTNISDEVAHDATIGWYVATPGVSWTHAGKYERAAMVARSKTILEAAYPAIRQQVAEEIAAALEAEALRHSVPTAAMVLDAVAAPLAREIGRKA